MDFEEVRRYQPGDDIRHMDWRVTARSGNPHLKVFREERQRSVFLIVDFSSSMLFGTRVALKSVIAAQAASLLAWASTKHGNRIGGDVFSNDYHRDVKPQGGHPGTLRFLHMLVDVHEHATPAETGQSPAPFSHALERVVRTARPGSLIFVLTDFPRLDRQIESSLKYLSAHHDVMTISITDPLEQEPPLSGQYRISDGTQFFDLDTTSHTWREAYRDRFQHRQKTYKNFCQHAGIGVLRLTTDASVPQALRDELRKLSQHKHQHLWGHRSLNA